MKAVVVRAYGGPEVLKLEEVPDPVAGPVEVLVRVAATSVNPADYKQRSGAMKEFMPIDFPGVIGLDVSGTVEKVGPDVEGFATGDLVFGMASRTYAELCVVKASNLVKVPAGMKVVDSAALPIVTTTGNQLITLGVNPQRGQTVLITGAAGNVGRSAIFTAKQFGATVIAGVRQKQLKDASALGADQVIETDDAEAINALPPLDAVADTVGGKTAEAAIAKIKKNGVFASVLGAPANAKDFPTVKVVPVYVRPDAKALLTMALAVREGKLSIPVGMRLPLRDAAKGHAAAEENSAGKVLLVTD
jgi:NADPH:quinone reductase-like Zn-dependent oxidoreductase